MVTFGKREIEVKFKIEKPNKIRTALAGMIAERTGVVREKNTYFVNKELRIGELGGTIVRLRTYTGQKNGLLTYKGKQDPSEKTFKMREEIEFEVPDAEMVMNFLKAIGLKIGWLQEKEREVWRVGNADVAIDLLPTIGYYLEIEGEKEAIFITADILGLNMKNSTSKSYRELYVEECRKFGTKPGNMVFDAGEKNAGK